MHLFTRFKPVGCFSDRTARALLLSRCRSQTYETLHQQASHSTMQQQIYLSAQQQRLMSHGSAGPSSSKVPSTWAGAKASQEELMIVDECIIVDEQDNITGHANKAACHMFGPDQPRGQLHRAFSVFLFDDAGRLLLQQRASSKITFPSVWTNTCCSHPLYGQSPDEVDGPEAVARGDVPGIKAAAVRKLEHELGIPPSQVPASAFTYLTRLHYCARDTHTWGPDAKWGEHEVDYVLFIRANVSLKPNPDEVDATRFVTREELAAMMDPASGLRWSPWFRILAQRFLPGWWADLEGALAGAPQHRDLKTVHSILD